MSRSRKKTKIHGITTARSEKKNKQQANRIYRRIVKERLKLPESELPEIRAISNVWDFDKDGKKYDSEIDEKLMRK